VPADLNCDDQAISDINADNMLRNHAAIVSVVYLFGWP
jgi:hypothetical protein